jgi:hypothetical protein
MTVRTGTVVDISTTGCFVLTMDDVQNNELIRVEIRLIGGTWISLWGEIVYQVPEIGFGLKFTDIGQTSKDVIALLVDYSLMEKTLTESAA